MEEQLKKLLTDDPSVVESSIEKCAEAAYPEKTGVLRRFGFLNPGDTKLLPCILIPASKLALFLTYLRIDLLDKCFGHDTVEEIIDSLVSPTYK